MLPWLLDTETCTLTRYGAQTVDPVTRLPTQATTTSSVVMQSEPWRSDRVVQRPDGVYSEDLRVFASPVEVRGVGSQASASAAWPDRITDAAGVTWQVVEVIAANAIGPIIALWHAYCVRVRPGDEGPA